MQIDQREINLVNNSVGETVLNNDGKHIGYIAGVFTTRQQENSEYLILGTDLLFGDTTRFFAIPLSGEIITVSKTIIQVNLDSEELMQAKRISLEKCPKPLFDFDPLIYEITDYRNSGQINVPQRSGRLNPA